MKYSQEILLIFYQEELKQAVNHEVSRAGITNLILILTGIVITAITFDESINDNDLSLALFLVILGVFGMVFNLKYYERYYFHYYRAKEYRTLLEQQNQEVNFTQARKVSDSYNRKRFKIINKVRLNWLWVFLTFLISICGLTLTIIIINS